MWVRGGGAEVSGEDAEEELSDMEPENKIPGYRQENKKICLQPCFRFLKAKLLHRVCLVRLPLAGTPLGSNLAGTHVRMQDSKRTKQSACSSERSDRWITATDGDQLKVAASGKDRGGVESASRCWAQTSAS